MRGLAAGSWLGWLCRRAMDAVELVRFRWMLGSPHGSSCRITRARIEQQAIWRLQRAFVHSAIATQIRTCQRRRPCRANWILADDRPGRHRGDRNLGLPVCRLDGACARLIVSCLCRNSRCSATMPGEKLVSAVALIPHVLHRSPPHVPEASDARRDEPPRRPSEPDRDDEWTARIRWGILGLGVVIALACCYFLFR